MPFLNDVFKAQAQTDFAAQLATPKRRSAYVFGAASALGEAVLNQLLASPLYQQVYVSCTAALPATIAHLQGMPVTTPPIALDPATAVDWVLIVTPEATNTPSAWGSQVRQQVYAPLSAEQVPALLAQCDALCLAYAQANPYANQDTNQDALENAPENSKHVRYLLLCPAAPHTSSALGAVSAHSACWVYVGDGKPSSTQAYQFKPQGNSLLDKLGMWVLNTLSGVAHGLMNPDKTAPLSSVKTAQRLVGLFLDPLALARPAGSPVITISAQQLRA